MNYNKQITAARNTVDFNDINQFLTVRMFNDASESVRGNVHLEKTIKKFKYKFDVGFDYSTYVQELNNTLTNNRNNNYDYEVAIETLFDKFPTIEIGVRQDFGNFTTVTNTTRFITTEPFITIDYSFLEGFVFNFDYEKNIYHNRTLNQKNIYEIANATLSYQKENSSWSYKITAQNLFNASFRQSNSFSDFLISDSRTFILPRIIMFSIGYNL